MIRNEMSESVDVDSSQRRRAATFCTFSPDLLWSLRHLTCTLPLTAIFRRSGAHRTRPPTLKSQPEGPLSERTRPLGETVC